MTPRATTLSAAALLTLLLAGCGTSTEPAAPDGGAAATVSSLGAVPIPVPPSTEPTPTARPGAAQLLAMGAPTVVELDGAAAVVTASGPSQLASGPLGPGATTPATMTLTASTTRGAVTLDAADLTCRDDSGAEVSLTAAGPATAAVPAPGSGSVAVAGTFRSGSAQLSWHPGGRLVATWDFTIELD